MIEWTPNMSILIKMGSKERNIVCYKLFNIHLMQFYEIIVRFSALES